MSVGLMDKGVNHLWIKQILVDRGPFGSMERSRLGNDPLLGRYVADRSTFYEAARIDGASKLRQIRSITFHYWHHLNLILNVSNLEVNLDQTLVLMNSQNQNRSEVINSFVYKNGVDARWFLLCNCCVGLGSRSFPSSYWWSRIEWPQIEQRREFSYLIGGKTWSKRKQRKHVVYFFNTVILILFSLMIIVPIWISWFPPCLLVLD